MLTVAVNGVAKLQAKLERTLLEEPVTSGLARLGSRALALTADAFRGGTGRAARSLSLEIQHRSVEVVSSMPDALISLIDEGRAPGTPIKALLPGLIHWKDAVGYQGWAIDLAHEIKERGTPGKRIAEAVGRRLVVEEAAAVVGIDRAVEHEWER